MNQPAFAAPTGAAFRYRGGVRTRNPQSQNLVHDQSCCPAKNPPALPLEVADGAGEGDVAGWAAVAGCLQAEVAGGAGEVAGGGGELDGGDLCVAVDVAAVEERGSGGGELPVGGGGSRAGEPVVGVEGWFGAGPVGHTGRWAALAGSGRVVVLGAGRGWLVVLGAGGVRRVVLDRGSAPFRAVWCRRVPLCGAGVGGDIGLCRRSLFGAVGDCLVSGGVGFVFQNRWWGRNLEDNLEDFRGRYKPW
jgi:hypothetical protein